MSQMPTVCIVCGGDVKHPPEYYQYQCQKCGKRYDRHGQPVEDMTDHDTAPGPMSAEPAAIDVPTRLEEIELRLSYYSKSATPGWYRDDVRYLLNLAKAAIAERDAARARLVEVEATLSELDEQVAILQGYSNALAPLLLDSADDAAPDGTTGGGA